jgi:hypothetical protein
MGGVYRGREAIRAFVAEAAKRAYRQFVAKSEQVSEDRYAVEWNPLGRSPASWEGCK